MKRHILILIIALAPQYILSAMPMVKQNMEKPFPYTGIHNEADTYSYRFTVEGITSYAIAKPYIDFVDEIFSKRPSFNDETGMFEVNESPVYMTQAALAAKLGEQGLILTGLTLVTPSIDNSQPK